MMASSSLRGQKDKIDGGMPKSLPSRLRPARCPRLGATGGMRICLTQGGHLHARSGARLPSVTRLSRSSQQVSPNSARPRLGSGQIWPMPGPVWTPTQPPSDVRAAPLWSRCKKSDCAHAIDGSAPQSHTHTHTMLSNHAYHRRPRATAFTYARGTELAQEAVAAAVRQLEALR